MVIAKELGAPSAGGTGGDRVFVLGVLDDAVQFLAEGQLHALVGTSGDLGTRQLLVGDEVAFLKAVSVAAQGLGVQQGRRGDTCVHTKYKAISQRVTCD